MKKLKKPNLKDLEVQVDYYIEKAKDVSTTSDELSDIENSIFETAIEAFYGNCWNELNLYLELK